MRADGLPLVSVVTPCLNQARYLGETIASVQGEAYPDLEHVVVDGGSTDGSWELLQRLGDRVRALSAPGSNQSCALNLGFRAARGEVLGWLNGDDLYEPGAVAAVAQVFREDPEAVMVYGDCANIDGAGAVFSTSRSRPFDYDRLLRHWPNFIPQPTVFFRRRALGQVGWLDESLEYAMDYDLWLRLGRAGRAVYLPRVLARFRVHPGSKTGGCPERFWPEIRRVSRRHGGGFWSPLFVKHLRDDFYLWRRGLRRRWIG